MQTLNVGAGRTDEDYKAAEEQRRTDLRDDSRNDANYFFWAAGLAALGTGSAAAVWFVTVLALGFLGRSGRRWAFIVGIVLYAADMIALIVTFSLWAFGVHAFFVFKWFQGQKALQDLRDADVLSSSKAVGA